MSVISNFNQFPCIRTLWWETIIYCASFLSIPKIKFAIAKFEVSSLMKQKKMFWFICRNSFISMCQELFNKVPTVASMYKPVGMQLLHIGRLQASSLDLGSLRAQRERVQSFRLGKKKRKSNHWNVTLDPILPRAHYLLPVIAWTLIFMLVLVP